MILSRLVIFFDFMFLCNRFWPEELVRSLHPCVVSDKKCYLFDTLMFKGGILITKLPRVFLISAKNWRREKKTTKFTAHRFSTKSIKYFRRNSKNNSRRDLTSSVKSYINVCYKSYNFQKIKKYFWLDKSLENIVQSSLNMFIFYRLTKKRKLWVFEY